MPRLRTVLMSMACVTAGLAIACGDDGGGGENEPTPGVTTVGLQTQIAGIVSPFPTPVINGGSVDSSASKGYTATFPEGWTFYPNRIQTRDASADIAFEPLTAGATAQASIVVNCITQRQQDQAAHSSFEATKVARIGTNTQIQTGERQISGLNTTVITYHFESQNEANIPPLEKQDILFSNGKCDWIITTTTPEGRRAEFEPTFNAFLESFRLTG